MSEATVLSERLHWLTTKCSRLLRRGKREAALDAELQFHFDQLIAEFRTEGMSEHDARLAAQREFGAVSAYREEIRDTWRPPELADLWRSLRFAARSLIRTPGFTLLAIVTLGFGIGGNTMMYSALNTVALKPLPYPNSAQLERFDRATPQNPEGRVSPADFLDLRRQVQDYGDIAAYSLGDASLSEKGQPAEMVRAMRNTANMFSTLGVPLQLGREFLPHEEVPGGDRVVIISQRCWKNRFGGSADVIGRTVRVDGEPHEIVGVLPPAFNDWRHLGAIDFFRPLALDEQKASDRYSPILRIIGRRSEKLSHAEASSMIANFGKRLAKDFPEIHAGTSWRTVPLTETVQGKNGRATLGMCVGLSAFVLLIACSNLANLLLARTMCRAREFALRGALGASRVQLLGPLMIESLLLALAGGACAILVASWGGDWLSVRSMGDNGERVVLMFDWRVFSWAFGAAVLTAIAFGLAPALFALRLNVNDTLKSGARSTTGGRGHRRFRHLLIIGQFALAMVLLAGAALFIRGLDELNHRRSGWESDRLVTGTIMLPAPRYSDPDKVTAFRRLIIERLQALPGVASASLSSFTPFFNWADVRKYVVEGRELPVPGREPAAVVNCVSSGYFETMGTRVLAGRAFSDGDTASSPKVFIISQSMANGLFGNDNPIGRRIAQAGSSQLQWGEIIGVAVDVKSVLPDPGPVTFQLYQPITQGARPYNEIAVRTSNVAPSTVVPDIRNIMTELDPDLPVRQLQPADATIERANYQTAVLRDILTSFAVLGLGLAALGVYGVIARTTIQRTSEFAIRFALGACVKDITRIVLSSGVKLALIGSGLGLFGALAVARFLAATNPGMKFNNAPVLIGTTLLLTAVALVACWLPARRAARINPIEALRAE